MVHELRQRVADERGFTLIELLVVILIIGILAAIAIPAFISQRDKANDAAAKAFVRGMQTAEETYFTDNDKYVSGLVALQTIDPELGTAPSGTAPTASGTATTFTVTATSNSGVAYTITHASSGSVQRSCAPADKGGCNAGGSW